MQLRMQKIQSDGTSVKFEGNLDRETVPHIRRELLSFSGKKLKGQIAFDLSGVAQMDTAGVALLVEAFQRLSRRGVRMYLSGLSERAKRLIYLARLEQLFDLEDDRRSAL